MAQVQVGLPPTPPTANKTLGNESAVDIINGALRSTEKAFASESIDAITKLFAKNGWWRDILTVDRFDFNSRSAKDIPAFLKQFDIPKLSSFKIVDPHKAEITMNGDAVQWVEGYIAFEMPDARGKGHVRLVQEDGQWKYFTFFTYLWEIKGHEEHAYHRRPFGAEHGEHTSEKNWLDHRREDVKFEKNDPTVLIVGAGQNGLMLAARLTVLGIPTLLVEKNPRIGDSWRNRYHTLCLHDPVWADFFPYLKYPPSWPVYTPKDKLANWMEFYADTMELNYWTQSTIERNPTYDPKAKNWTVTVTRNGQPPRRMVVNHLVLATGLSGEPKLPDFPRDAFKGTIHHSSAHPGGKGWAGKKAVVVGCCNSGHDIAADLYENGADVTMIQRSWTYVMSSEHGIREGLKGIYEEDGPEIEDADIKLMSIPMRVQEEFNTAATKRVTELDKDLLEGLTRAGFKLNPYPKGLFIKYYRDGGGYYIDVGASKMIADGKIKIKQGVEVDKLTESGVLMADGTHLDADIIVLATGYTSMRDTIRRVISDDVADRVGPCWGEDGEGEIPTVWRASGVDRFYLQCGNFAQARSFSKPLSLIIQQQELGLGEPKYPNYKEVKNSKF